MNEKDVKNQEHYTSGKLEPIQLMSDSYDFDFTSYCLGNILKYLVRYPKKNGMEDLRKARVYAEFIFNHRQGRPLKSHVTQEDASKFTLEESYWTNTGSHEEYIVCFNLADELMGDEIVEGVNEDQEIALAHIIFAMRNSEKSGFIVHTIDKLIKYETALKRIS